ncbi:MULTISPECIES: EthD family reductase [Microvirga]|uniref:EthD family reductase n=1 Tax=Microvirga TaxID=186650 RepID=UPI001CFFCB16|nr:EthD family reductase [Microvirga lenta]MCB5175877.1 EthD family reductase [Microvirga lenta]
MILVTVMYPNDAEAAFDRDYYLQKHIPLVKERWTELGLTDVQILSGVGQPNGNPPMYRMIALLTFGSLQQFKDAGKAHGREIFADIANFTNVQPIMQINEIAG